MHCRCWAILVACTLSFGVARSADTTGLDVGEYISREGVGTLIITDDGTEKQRITLSTMDRNHSMCHFEGSIVGEESIFEHAHDWQMPGAKEEPCKIAFQKLPNAVRVATSNFWACSGYCGKQTTFEDDYFIPEEGCDSNSLRHSLGEYKRKYDSHAYSVALELVTRRLSTCSRTMDWTTHNKSLVDKAQAENQLGMTDACRTTLEPLRHDAERYPLEVRSEMSLDAFDDYYPILEEAQHLLQVCAPHVKPAERAL